MSGILYPEAKPEKQDNFCGLMLNKLLIVVIFLIELGFEVLMSVGLQFC